MIVEEDMPKKLTNTGLISAPTKTSKMLEEKLAYQQRLKLGVRSRMRALAEPKVKTDHVVHNINFAANAENESELAHERAVRTEERAREFY